MSENRRPGRRLQIQPRLELHRLRRTMRQSCILGLHRGTRDQHDQLLAAFPPGHPRRERRRQNGRHPPGLDLRHTRPAAHPRGSRDRDLQQEETRELAGVDLHLGAVGDVVHREVGIGRRMVAGMEALRPARQRAQEMWTEQPADLLARLVRRAGVDGDAMRQRHATLRHHRSPPLREEPDRPAIPRDPDNSARATDSGKTHPAMD